MSKSKLFTTNRERQADLADNVKIAQHLLNTELMHADPKWLSARVDEQQVIIEKANSEIVRLREVHSVAANKLPELRRNLALAETALSNHMNRGELSKAEDKATKLVAMIAKLRESAAAGRMSVEEIAAVEEATGIKL